MLKCIMIMAGIVTPMLVCVSAVPTPAGFLPSPREAVSSMEEQSLWRLFSNRVGYENVQLSRARTVATNAWGRVVDLPFTRSDGVKCHYGVLKRGSHMTSSYLSYCGLGAVQGAGVEEVRARVQQCLPAVREGANLTGVKRLLSAKTAKVMCDFGKQEFAAPFENFWFCFVDENPLAEWGHRARMVFVSEDLDQVTVFYVNMPARVLEGDQPVRLEALTQAPKMALKSGVLKLNALPSDGQKQPFPAVTGGDATHCYALLICGGGDKAHNHCRYWKETCLVYNVMRQRFQLPRNHIKVLWASGDPSADLCEESDCRIGFPSDTDLSDFDLDGNSDITGSTSVDDVKAAFKWYRDNLTTEDQLLIFVTDHGSGGETYGEYGQACAVLWGGIPLSDEGLAYQTKDIKGAVLFALKTCYGGGMIPEIIDSANNRIVATSDDYDPSKPYLWTHYFFSALCGYYPYGEVPDGFSMAAILGSNVDPRSCGAACTGADLNGDGKVSFHEAHQFAVKMNRYTADNGLSGEDIDKPMYAESKATAGLGDRIFGTKYPETPVVVRSQVATPSFVTDDGQFAPYVVQVACDTTGATIRYTLDGSEPNESSSVVGEGILIDRDVTVTIRAFKGGMDGSRAAAKTYLVRKTAPEAPTIMSVSQNDLTTAIVVRWLTADGASSYEVIRGTSSSMAGASVIQSGIAATCGEYADTGTVPGQTYCYRVRARNAYGTTDSGVSAPATRSLMPPSGVSVTPSGSGNTAYADISWRQVQGAGRYRVWRKIGADAPEAVSDWLTALTYRDTVPKTTETIYYAVTAAVAQNSGETAKSAFCSMEYPDQLLDWKLSVSYNGDKTRAQVVPGGGGIELRCYFIDSEGKTDKNFTSGVTWSIDQVAGHVSHADKSGSSFVNYTPPTTTLTAEDGTYDEKIVVRASYNYKGVERTCDFPVVVSKRKIVKSVYLSAENTYMFPGEQQQLKPFTIWLNSNAPGEEDIGEAEWSIVSGDGATLDDGGVLTAFDGNVKSAFKVQLTYTNRDGTFSCVKDFYVNPPELLEEYTQIPAEGGDCDWVHLGNRDGSIIVNLQGTWLGGFKMRAGGVYISLGRGNNNIGVTGDKYVAFRADRNGGEDREATIVLRWNLGQITLRITQESAVKADTPAVDVDGMSVSSSCRTDGTVLHYALDGEEPDSDSPIAGDDFDVPAGSRAIAVKAFGEWVRTSETAYADIDDGYGPEEVGVSFETVEDADECPEDRVYRIGETFGELPTLTHPLLYFKGWTLDPDSHTKVSAAGLVPAEGCTLHAVWSTVAEDEPEWVALPWDFAKRMATSVVVSNAWTGKLEDCATCRIGVIDAEGKCRGFSGNGSEESGLSGLGAEKSWPFSFGVYGADGTEVGLKFRVWRDGVGYLNVLNPDVGYDPDATCGSESEPYVIVVGPAVGGDLEFGVGCGSLFAWNEQDGVAKLVGVSGLSANSFVSRISHGEGTQTTGAAYLCFEDARIVDAEKNATQDDADDYWCPALTQLNMAYWGGWVCPDEFATVDAAADYLRTVPQVLCDYSKGDNGIFGQEGVIDWLRNATLRDAYGPDDMADYWSSVDDQSVGEFLEESFANRNALVGLCVYFPAYVWKGEPGVGHMVTCCGHVCDMSRDPSEAGYLKGLFIIDSDNDMYNGSGGAAAPNRITYCPVEWDDDERAYRIENIFGTVGFIDAGCLYALRAIKPLAAPSFRCVYEEDDGERVLVGIEGVCPETLVIEDGVTEIGDCALSSPGSAALLKHVKIPASVKKIGRFAFEDCYALQTVEIGRVDVSIDSLAFYGGRQTVAEGDGSRYDLLPCISLQSVTVNVTGMRMVGWHVVANGSADMSKNGDYPVGAGVPPVVGQLYWHTQSSGGYVADWLSYELTPILERIGGDEPAKKNDPEPVVDPQPPIAEPKPAVAPIVEPTGAFEAPKATTTDGVVIRDGAAVAVVQLKVGKASKGESKVSVTVTGLDGKKYSSGSVKVKTGETATVSLDVKKIGTMTLMIGADGFVGTLDGATVTSVAGTAAATPGYATFEATDLTSLKGALEEYFPKGEKVSRSEKKWAVAAKAGKLKYDKKAATLVATGENIAGLKLTYASKTQTFKGSFKVWTFDETKKKLKSVSATVTGVVVNGKGYGLVMYKKAKVGELTVE